MSGKVPPRAYTCRLCGHAFTERPTETLLLLLFCPRCRDLYRAAVASVVRFEERGLIERHEDWPHAAVIVAGLPRRDAA